MSKKYGGFYWYSSTTAPSVLVSLSLLDLNGDGHPDAVPRNFVFTGHSGGSFGPVQTVITKGTAAFAPIVRRFPAVFYVYVNGNEIEYRLNTSKP